MRRRGVCALCCMIALSLMAGLRPGTAETRAVASPAIDAAVLEELRSAGRVRVLIYLQGEPDLSAAAAIADWEERGDYVLRQMQEAAQRAGGALLASLMAAGSEPRLLLTANAIAATVDARLLSTVASRAEVRRVGLNARMQVLESSEVAPVAGQGEPSRDKTVEWNIAKIRADEAWQAFGIRGQGIVVGDIGTGVMYNHDALAFQYRGHLGGGDYDHNYNWFDFVNGVPVPYDDSYHSTFGVGIAVGSDGINEIGVAPWAQWIAVKALSGGGGATLEDLHAAMQWMLAPTDLNGQNPEPAKRPHVGLNMWGIFASCDYEFLPDLQAWLAAGILPVFRVGSQGSACLTVLSPADLLEAYTAGATDSNDLIASFSSRGPGCGGVLKPEVSAPGVNIRSSNNDGGYIVGSGTSWSAAHLAGVAALVLSADPGLGQADLMSIIETTAVCREDLTCFGSPCPDGANNVYGWGRIDSYEAVALALSELPAVHVGNIRLRVRDRGAGRYVVLAAVRVLDEGGVAVEGAKVGVEWTYPNGSRSSQEAVSNQAGVAWFRLKSRFTGVHEVCVTAVTKAGMVYDPGANRETCDGVAVP